MPVFIQKSKRIPRSYFTTKKGFKSGDPKEKAIEVYGRPDKISSSNGIEKCTWIFTSDIFYDGRFDLKGKPLVRDSYGHRVKMFFRDGKLIGLIFYNDMP